MKKRFVRVKFTDDAGSHKITFQTSKEGEELELYAFFRVRERASGLPRDVVILEQQPKTREQFRPPVGIEATYSIRPGEGGFELYRDGLLVDGFRDRGAAENQMVLERIKDGTGITRHRAAGATPPARHRHLSARVLASR